MTECSVGSRQILEPGIGRHGAGNERTAFRYSIGDFCLFKIGFSVLRSHFPFDPEGERFEFPQKDPDFPEGINAIGYSGAIVASNFPRLRWHRRGFYYVPNRDINYYIDLQQTFSAYLDGFSAKTRNTLKRKVRHITQSMEFRCFRTTEELSYFYEAAHQIAPKTYQARLFGGAIPGNPEFVAKTKALSEGDGFRGFTLSLNGRPVSYLHLPIENGVVIYGYTGYDPEFRKLSVGSVLLYLALEKIFSENAHHYFDFTYGEGQTKRIFGRSACFRGDIYFFRWTTRNLLMVLGHVVMGQISKAAGKTLGAVRLRGTVRRLIRRL